MVGFVKTDYPLIFVHGMFGWGENEGINKLFPYWGTTTGSLTEYLTSNEIECYAASVGPMSSAWDQACELYAQLTGTRVDYGKVHSAAHNHKQYGRTYHKPLFEGWSENKKIHLIGHSFGGNVIRMLVHLLKYGSPEEIAVSADEVSPLFVGGQEKLVCSITAICTPLNGTSAYGAACRYRLVSPLKHICFNYAALLSRTFLHGRLLDFHLEQFGVNDTPGISDKTTYVKAVKNMLKSEDNVEFDMSEKGISRMNEMIKTVDSVYCFSYRFNSVEKNKKGVDSPLNSDFLFLKATSKLMLMNGKNSGACTQRNDGLVDVASAMYPANEPYELYDENVSLKPGVWNVMPTRQGDHGTPIGLFSDRRSIRSFYDEMVYILSSVECHNKNRFAKHN